MSPKTDPSSPSRNPAQGPPADLLDEQKTTSDSGTAVSRALRQAGKDPRVIDEILPMVYDELHTIASVSLRKERAEHTLSATALVHEAYLRLCGSEPTPFRGREHFFSAAAVAMRRVLVDHARRQLAQKRIPRQQTVTLEDSPELVSTVNPDILALDEALCALGDLDQRLVKTVELRYFAGLTEAQTAQVLGVAPSTARRFWATAKVWLRRRLAQ